MKESNTEIINRLEVLEEEMKVLKAQQALLLANSLPKPIVEQPRPLDRYRKRENLKHQTRQLKMGVKNPLNRCRKKKLILKRF